MSGNPWVQGTEVEAEREEAERAETVTRLTLTVPMLEPQAAIARPAAEQCLPRRAVVTNTACVWWVGVHGGAGESTLEQLLDGSRAAGHAWPTHDDSAIETPRVVLVARTNAAGLRAAQLAATEWASGTVTTQLLGLVLVADAPGRLPKVLKDLCHHVGGGVPRVWRVPFVDAWRLGEPIAQDSTPTTVRDVLDEVLAAIDLVAANPS